MVDHEGSSIPKYFQLSLPLVNTDELGLQDLCLDSQWLQWGFVPIKSEEMMLATVEKDIFKGTGHVHSLTFHESQKRRWGIYLLEASQLLQEVHQSVRQKAVEKRLFPKVVSLIQGSLPSHGGASTGILQPWEVPLCAGLGREDSCWSYKVSTWLKYCRETAENPGAHTKF